MTILILLENNFYFLISAMTTAVELSMMMFATKHDPRRDPGPGTHVTLTHNTLRGDHWSVDGKHNDHRVWSFLENKIYVWLLGKLLCCNSAKLNSERSFQVWGCGHTKIDWIFSCVKESRYCVKILKSEWWPDATRSLHKSIIDTFEVY